MNYLIKEQPDGKWKLICYQNGKRVGSPLYCNTWEGVVAYLNCVTGRAA